MKTTFMNYLDFRYTLLHKYHKDINYVFKVIGEIFDGSKELTQDFYRKSYIDRELYYLGYNFENKSWFITSF